MTKECPKCGKQHGKQGRFCSRSCANSRTENRSEINEKISRKLKKLVEKSCKLCGKDFQPRIRRQLFCSKLCACRFNVYHVIDLSRAGRRSAEKQSESRRSKNEIYFYELCDKKFEHVEHNKSIFDGWDADVIIYDLKIAILWNGKWHYEKITENHSVEQVQTRDKIKIQKIQATGYRSYVIKDMGRYDPEFVEKQFQLFLHKFQQSGGVATSVLS